MAILNYTTTIDLHKTALEVQRMLAIKGAQALMLEYENGEPSGISFRMAISGQEISFRMPVNWRGVEKVMRTDRKVPGRLKNAAQARRVAWRILKDWIEAQMAIIESGQTQMAEV